MTNIEASDAAWVRPWLDDAFARWWDAGWDHEHGGFFDKLEQDARPFAGDKRVRVQTRQVFVYAQAAQLGWNGPWRQAVEEGLRYIERFRRSDGLFRRTVSREGAPADDSADLYDQAFVLFALAAAHEALGRPEALRRSAEDLLSRLVERAGHSGGRGFREIDGGDGALRSNPQMHLLEALLAWQAAAPGGAFEKSARGIVALAADRLIDPATGAVGEYYDDDWCFLPDARGAVREPGHQFEWAYLLDHADRLLGTDHRAQATRLAAFGAAYGIRDGRAIFSLDATGAPTDVSSRLWAQTERLRTAVLLPEAAGGEAAVAESLQWIRRMLDTPVGGLWFDRVADDGAILNEPAPASSFYHLITGFVPLLARDTNQGT